MLWRFKCFFLQNLLTLYLGSLLINELPLCHQDRNIKCMDLQSSGTKQLQQSAEKKILTRALLECS